MPSNIQLAAKVDALEKMIANINIGEKSKPRNTTEKGVAHKAKILFYQDNKNNDSTKAKSKELFGAELGVSFQNYPKLKKCTDNMFDKLSANEKDKYIASAKSKK
jgi:hypothetical protein